MAGWSSGWVNTDGTTAVANGATLNFTHDLGTTDFTFSAYLADDTNGTNIRSIDQFEIDLASNFYGSQIQNIDPNTLTLQLGSSGIVEFTNTGGNGGTTSYDGKYIKVVAIAAISDPVPGTGDLCKILSEDSGYQMFRNGLTMQWMSSPAFITESSQVVNFPIPFASKPFKVVASTRYPDGDAVSQTFFQVVSWTKDGATIFAQSGVGAFNPVYADIIAIGIADVTDCPASGGGGGGGGGDVDGIKISQLTTAAELKDDDLFVISKENTGDGIYDISQKVALSEIATYIAGAEPPAPTPPAEGIVHFSSKIISNAASSTESKAFEDDDSSDITAAGVYEIQSTYAFEEHVHSPGLHFVRLDPARAGDGWNSSAGLGKAVPTVAKQDLKSMAIPAGTTVKFSLDWTHLGATYVHHQYTREDLIFFEITGPALIVDLSPDESLPDASAGTHLASMGITQGNVYNWYNILQYPAAGQVSSPRTIFNRGTASQRDADIREPCYTNTKVNNLYINLPGGQNAIGRWGEIVGAEQVFSQIYNWSIDGLFKLPASNNGTAIDQRTLRNMPYTSTLIIE